MTDRATQAFIDELLKESASSPVPGKTTTRIQPPGMQRDEGIIQMQKKTQQTNEGTLGFNATQDFQKLKDKRRAKVLPGQPESPWRIDKIGEAGGQEREFLLAPDTGPVHLANQMNAKYGRGWLDWEPETLWETIRKDWLTYPNEESKNKLMAIKVLMASESFWNDWEVFEKICIAFNDRVPNFHVMDDLSTAELTLAVRLASKLKKRSFGSEVQAYVASEGSEDGYILLPEDLAFAQEKLDFLMQGTPGEALKEELKDRNLLTLDVKDEEDPVHIQAGYLQAVAVYLKMKDTHEVGA